MIEYVLAESKQYLLLTLLQLCWSMPRVIGILPARTCSTAVGIPEQSSEASSVAVDPRLGLRSSDKLWRTVFGTDRPHAPQRCAACILPVIASGLFSELISLHPIASCNRAFGTRFCRCFSPAAIPKLCDGIRCTNGATHGSCFCTAQEGKSEKAVEVLRKWTAWTEGSCRPS